MTALIAVYTGDGCAGRCDAKCYNAWGPECHCICQGANHGAGRQEAIENTRELGESWLEQARADWASPRRARDRRQHEPLFSSGAPGELRAPLVTGTIVSLAVTAAWAWMSALTIGPAGPAPPDGSATPGRSFRVASRLAARPPPGREP